MTMLEWRARYDQQLRYGYNMPGYRREVTRHLVRYVSLWGEKGYVLWSNPGETSVRRIIQDEIAYFAVMRQPFEWKVFDYDTPSHFPDFLVQEGFQADEPESVMVKSGSVAKTSGHLPMVIEITTVDGIGDIIKLEQAIWNQDFDDLKVRLIRDKDQWPDRMFLYGVYLDQQLVSAAWMYLEAGSSFATFWGGSTLPALRGRGCYTALLQARSQKAVEAGHPCLTVDARPMSRPILERHGFLCLGTTTGFQSPNNWSTKQR